LSDISLVGVSSAAEIEIKKLEERADVEINGELFTQYIFTGHAKPIWYSIIGPHGVLMTRNHPMNDVVDNEVQNHPHHKLLWFIRETVNGVQYLMEDPGKNSSGCKKRMSLSIRTKECFVRRKRG
jgi:hypothetical protein